MKLLFSLFLVAFLLMPTAATAGAILDVGNVFPGVSLDVSDEKDAKYLGVSGKLGIVWGGKKFSVGDVKADIVVVQIFSMYCPYCQADAPKVNALFARMRADAQISNKVKLIGIGAGNTDFEVATFKKKYAIDFPLFSDGDFTTHKKIGEVRTPYFIIVKRERDKRGVIVYSKLGSLESVDAFFNTIKGMAAR